MKIKVILLFLLLNFSGSKLVWASDQLDSLWNIWADESQSDSLRLRAIKKYTWDGFLFTQPDSAYYFAGLHYDFAKECGNEKQMARALFAQGTSRLIKGKFDEAERIFMESVSISLKINDQTGASNTFSNIGNIHYYRGDFQKAIDFFTKSVVIDEQLGKKEGLAGSLINIGNLYIKMGNFDTAMDLYNRSLVMQEELKNDKGIAGTYNNLGNIFKDQGDYAKAIEFYTKSLSIQERLNNKSETAIALLNIGTIYALQYDYDKALVYYKRSLNLEEKLNNKINLSTCLSSIGDVYLEIGQLDTALYYHEKSLVIREEIGSKDGIANSLIQIGRIQLDQGHYEQAIEYSKKSLKLSQDLGFKTGISMAYQNLSLIYSKMGLLDQSIQYGQKSLKLAQEIGIANETKNMAFTLYQNYKNKNQYQDALNSYELYITTRDTIENQENQKEVIRQEYKYAYEKQALADSIKNAELQKVKDAELAAQKAISEQQRLRSYFLYGGLLVAIFIGIFIYNRLKLTRKQKGIIEEQKEQVDQAFLQLEEKNVQIMDSIKYAKRIQSAILPPRSLVDRSLKNSFILYKPKDIVAGDFYWLEPQGEQVLFAAADCTGHGVPGAMVSVVCNNSLNRAVREYHETDPGKILDKTRELVIEEFEKSEEDVQDGMDIALCMLQGNKLSYAGANNPLWVIRKGANIIEEYKANKQPIGKYTRNDPFDSHEIELEKGDTIYIFSDGFIDQFGGPNGKKLKSAKFKNLLLEIQEKTMKEQHQILEDYFNEWKGDLEQLDDVCVIGVRV
jgi:tetratricopeptide (TPR) repeat protein